MKRNHVHAVFAAGTLVFAALAAHQAAKLHQARTVNTMIVSTGLATLDSALPEARFAKATGLATEGRYDEAVAAYKDLTQSRRRDLELAAQFNLGNLHLLEALKHGPESEARWLPMIELAKQSYRTLLRQNPRAWDARYNLEHTLRLAPEFDETATTDEGPPPDSERTTSTISSTRMELP